MQRSMLLSLAAAVVPIASPLHAQTSKPAQPVNIERVKGDLYMISGEGGNVAVYVTGAGVILVDDMFYRNSDDIVAKVATVTDRADRLRAQHTPARRPRGRQRQVARDRERRRARERAHESQRHQATVLRGHARHADRPAEHHVRGRAHAALGRQGDPSALLWPRPHQRRRGRLLSGAEGHPHRRSLPRRARGGQAAAAESLPAAIFTSTTRRAAASSPGPARSTVRCSSTSTRSSRAMAR